MRVCYFGNYLPVYPRNVMLMRALREGGIEVIECHTRKTGIAKYWSLYVQHRALRGEYDVLMVGASCYSVVWFAKLFTRRPMVFDAFVSHYVTNVYDRKVSAPLSIRALYYWLLEAVACRCANVVLLDTNAQIQYFVENYRMARTKFIRVLVGADQRIYTPSPSAGRASSPRFIVHWHGYLVPFYSVETIIEAARILKDKRAIEFRIVTRFNTAYEELHKQVIRYGLTNVIFYPEMQNTELARHIQEASLCLGVFGSNIKAQLVIPNKIYEAAACGKAIITANHRVVREVFSEGKNIALCKSEDPEDLSRLILQLYMNRDRCIALGNEAQKLSNDALTLEKITRPLLEGIESLVRGIYK